MNKNCISAFRAGVFQANKHWELLTSFVCFRFNVGFCFNKDLITNFVIKQIKSQGRESTSFNFIYSFWMGITSENPAQNIPQEDPNDIKNG